MIGKVIKRLREGKRMTQDDLGKALGFTKGTVYAWEAGTRFPTLETLSQIADFFETTTDYLLGRTDSPGAEPEGKEPVLDEAITKAAAHGPEGTNGEAIALLNDRLDDILSEVERFKRLINQRKKEG